MNPDSITVPLRDQDRQRGFRLEIMPEMRLDSMGTTSRYGSRSKEGAWTVEAVSAVCDHTLTGPPLSSMLADVTS